MNTTGSTADAPPRIPLRVLVVEDAEEVASEAGADTAIPKETPLPEIISSLRRLNG